MDFRIKIKPVSIKGKTKDSLLESLGLELIHGTCGKYYSSKNYEGYAAGINFQKFNKKSKVLNTKLLFSNRIKIRDSYWEASIYFIPYYILTMNNLIIVQDYRNFRIKSNN